jgi:hypothetical protein
MKYFKADFNTWGEKVNFVDENNVLVGYDYSGQCCENFGWYLSNEINEDTGDTDSHLATDEQLVNTLLKDWVFDTEFFQTIKNGKSFDDSNIAVFRLTKNEAVMYLHLYNIHNGYYSHGFKFSKDEIVFKEGYL